MWVRVFVCVCVWVRVWVWVCGCVWLGVYQMILCDMFFWLRSKFSIFLLMSVSTFIFR